MLCWAIMTDAGPQVLGQRHVLDGARAVSIHYLPGSTSR